MKKGKRRTKKEKVSSFDKIDAWDGYSKDKDMICVREQISKFRFPEKKMKNKEMKEKEEQRRKKRFL